MDKYIIDVHTGLKYELVGDYYFIVGDDDLEVHPIVLSAGKRTCRKRRHHRNTQSGESNTLGVADERSTGNGDGDRQQ